VDCHQLLGSRDNSRISTNTLDKKVASAQNVDAGSKISDLIMKKSKDLTLPSQWFGGAAVSFQ
jgi:hypothetical protein